MGEELPCTIDVSTDLDDSGRKRMVRNRLLQYAAGVAEARAGLRRPDGRQDPAKASRPRTER